MDLIRALLLKLEERPDATYNRAFNGFDGYTKQEIAYNVSLMIDADLVKGETRLLGDGTFDVVRLTRFTWAGHEFLDAARNDTVWNESKQVIKRNGGSIPFDILKDLLKTMVRELVFSAPAV